MLWGIINSSETVVISLSGGYCGFSSFQRLIVKWNICYSLALLLAILEVKQIRKHHCQLIHKVLLKIQGIIFMEMAVCDRECFGLKKKSQGQANIMQYITFIITYISLFLSSYYCPRSLPWINSFNYNARFRSYILIIFHHVTGKDISLNWVSHLLNDRANKQEIEPR